MGGLRKVWKIPYFFFEGFLKITFFCRNHHDNPNLIVYGENQHGLHRQILDSNGGMDVYIRKRKSDFSQTISQKWTLSKGIKVNNRLNVEKEIDGVQVEDFVLRNRISTKEIPKVTFNGDVIVNEDVITRVS